MSTLTSRRAFLRGQATSTPVLRPPWALAEEEFLERCTHCNACIEACPTQILVIGDGGYPTVDFEQGECAFCTDCVNACEAKAFRSAEESPWTLHLTVRDSCLAHNGVFCMACVDTCPEQAIRLHYTSGVPVPQIDTSACTGCGACLSICPSHALALTPLEAKDTP